MTKALFLVVPDGFRDEEYSVPKEIFERNNIEVVTSSTQEGELTGKLGQTTAHIDILLDDINPLDYDTVLIVGGSRYYWNNDKVISIVKELSSADKVVSAICSSCAILVQSGVAVNKNLTSFPGEKELEEIKKLGGNYTGNDVEVDGKIVTACGPEAAEEFANKIVELL